MADSEYEHKIGDVINRPYFRLAFIVVCLLLLGFVAFKEGFSLWILSKLRLTSSTERLTSGEQAAINTFYPGVQGDLSGAQKQLNSWTNAYNSP